MVIGECPCRSSCLGKVSCLGPPSALVREPEVAIRKALVAALWDRQTSCWLAPQFRCQDADVNEYLAVGRRSSLLISVRYFPSQPARLNSSGRRTSRMPIVLGLFTLWLMS